MASTTQEKTMSIEGMAFAEFADPSYFIFANRTAQKQQKKTITPGMTSKLFYGSKGDIASSGRREAIDLEPSFLQSPVIRDENEEMVHFLDPWEGMMEFHPREMSKGNKKQVWSPMDPTGAFFGL